MDELEDIRDRKIDGMIIRSRSNWHEKGERSSKYFFNLEKQNWVKKSIPFLRENDKLISGEKNVLGYLTKHFQRIMSGQNEGKVETDIQEFVCRNVERRLTLKQQEKLDEPITEEELSKALYRMQNDRSPASTGFTAGFFKFFFPDLRAFLWRSFKNVFSTNSLSLTQREAIITLIPKPNGRSDRVKGWRPISLLNVQYKMLSSVVAERLKTVAPALISPDQTAYLKGRYIGENTRLLYDIIHEFHVRKLDGAILSIDFEDAFNSLNWDYTRSVFEAMGFGEQFMKLFEMMYTCNDSFSRIMLNGHLGEKIMHYRGFRQGDPASGLIFILAVEILANFLRKTEFRGIKGVYGSEVKISQYADDTIVFLEGKNPDIRIVMQQLGEYSKFSGLKPNISKCKCMWPGPPKSQFCEDLPLIWVTELKVLGVVFSANPDHIEDLNFPDKISSMKKLLDFWRIRGLSILGRVTVIKTLAISKFVQLFTTLPTPRHENMTKIKRMLFDFLWAGKKRQN